MLFLYYEMGGIYLGIVPRKELPCLQIDLTHEQLVFLADEIPVEKDIGGILEKVSQAAFKLGQSMPNAELRT